MIINFNDLQIPFHRLALGAILINPEDVRYMKFLKSCWVQDTDLFTQTTTSDTTMRGYGW